MSKIGRKSIPFNGAKVEIKGNDVHYSGQFASGVHVLPPYLKPQLSSDSLLILCEGANDKRKFWGLHRALLANALQGAVKEFETNVEIVGLGFKAEVSGKKVVFTLGFTNKITIELPKSVSLTVDKTGQKLLFKSANKEELGSVVATVKSLRPVEPYKGTGIKRVGDVVIRKAGKTKSK
jgi:large subunit ribosomal protein L6